MPVFFPMICVPAIHLFIFNKDAVCSLLLDSGLSLPKHFIKEKASFHSEKIVDIKSRFTKRFKSNNYSKNENKYYVGSVLIKHHAHKNRTFYS